MTAYHLVILYTNSAESYTYRFVTLFSIVEFLLFTPLFVELPIYNLAH